ncbi:MAG: ABC transporter ATP-binding protein [Candidatus Poribacteria bacterium]|nr:ABC transporter ATP-binding protein [Candidatus Poribacteria bacterium]
MTHDAIALRNIRKVFGDVQALDGVSFSLNKGEIHAALGENGAGKSTLMNVLYGLIRPDSGEIVVNGSPAVFHSPSDAIAAGIGMVHQHFMLVPDLTVAENLYLGSRSKQPFLFRQDVAQRDAQELVERYGLNVDVTRRIDTLPVGAQQRVEILKCLARDARTLILDEPTAVLTPQEVDDLNVVLRRLRESGHSIIFISHKLKEVLAICDRVTVLRRGRNVETLPIEEVDERALSEMMVGRSLTTLREREPTSLVAPVALELRDVSAEDARRTRMLNGVDLTVRGGEIFGIAGIDGNGQLELLEILAGVRQPLSGTVALSGDEITHLSPRERIERGMAIITEDRQHKGLVLEFSVAENVALKQFDCPPYAKRGMLNLRVFQDRADNAIQRFEIRASGPDQPVGTLSGGNQQKVIVAREVSLADRLLIAANPTRGLDVGAMEYVHQTLIDARNDGKAILLISTELDEILALSDRIGVLYSGNLAEITREDATRETLGRWMLGKREGDAA